MIFQREILTILSGAAPISEVRGAIPLGMFFFGFYPLKAYSLAVLGNALPVLPILFFLDRFSVFMMKRFYFFNRFFTWLFDYTRRRHGDHFHYWKWAPLALFVFVAIPLPLTGAWSGALAAFIFGISFWRAALAIFLGILVAGAIVLALTLLGIFTFNSAYFL
ncbi:MAG: small multi-drug export protein [Patescibacteria group bacterium]